jgi:hypothetical protein
MVLLFGLYDCDGTRFLGCGNERGEDPTRQHSDNTKKHTDSKSA